jgi:hypothetical protein
MGKHLVRLSKALASGLSRRASLKGFATGTVGALLTSVLPAQGEQVTADGVKDDCRDFCRGLDLNRRKRRQCVRRCINCERGGGHWGGGNEWNRPRLHGLKHMVSSWQSRDGMKLPFGGSQS